MRCRPISVSHHRYVAVYRMTNPQDASAPTTSSTSNTTRSCGNTSIPLLPPALVELPDKPVREAVLFKVLLQLHVKRQNPGAFISGFASLLVRLFELPAHRNSLFELPDSPLHIGSPGRRSIRGRSSVKNFSWISEEILSRSR